MALEKFEELMTRCAGLWLATLRTMTEDEFPWTPLLRFPAIGPCTYFHSDSSLGFWILLGWLFSGLLLVLFCWWCSVMSLFLFFRLKFPATAMTCCARLQRKKKWKRDWQLCFSKFWWCYDTWNLREKTKITTQTSRHCLGSGQPVDTIYHPFIFSDNVIFWCSEGWLSSVCKGGHQFLWFGSRLMATSSRAAQLWFKHFTVSSMRCSGNMWWTQDFKRLQDLTCQCQSACCGMNRFKNPYSHNTGSYTIYHYCGCRCGVCIFWLFACKPHNDPGVKASRHEVPNHVHGNHNLKRPNPCFMSRKGKEPGRCECWMMYVDTESSLYSTVMVCKETILKFPNIIVSLLIFSLSWSCSLILFPKRLTLFMCSKGPECVTHANQWNKYKCAATFLATQDLYRHDGLVPEIVSIPIPWRRQNPKILFLKSAFEQSIEFNIWLSHQKSDSSLPSSRHFCAMAQASWCCPWTS